MSLELRQRQAFPHGSTVAHDVKVGRSEVDNLLPGGGLYIRIADTPFTWNRPVEHLRPGWNFMHFQWKIRADLTERLPHAIAGNAPTDRKDLGGKSEDSVAGVFGT